MSHPFFSEHTSRVCHGCFAAAGGWRLGIQLAELFPFLSHAPRWEMIHENQKGKISPKAAE